MVLPSSSATSAGTDGPSDDLATLRWLVPIRAFGKFGPHVGAALAEGGAEQPDMIRPAVGADLDVVAATVVAAIAAGRRPVLFQLRTVTS